MKKTLTLLLCAGLFAYTGCKKEAQIIDVVTPCETKTWYIDADGDGLGNPNGETKESCEQPDGFVLDNTDPIDRAVERKNMPIMIKMSGETCPPCGGWGWTAWEDLSNNFLGKAFCWTNYGTFVSNGNFRGQEIEATMQAMQDRLWKSGSKPSFVTGNTDNGTTAANAETAANDFISKTPDVAAICEAKIEGDQLTLTAEVEFFADMPGDYVVGAYLVEDKVKGYQAGYSDPNNALHHLVMRGSLSDNPWGELIVEDGASAGNKVLKEFTATIPSTFNQENLSYGLIVWRKYGVAHLFMNAYTTQGL